MRASIICIVNNREIFRGFKENLETQEFKDYELIPMFNYDNDYDGARKALAFGAALAKGELLVFCHPDIRFLDGQALGDILEMVEDEDGVVGVAGAVPSGRGREIITSIVQGDNRSPVGSLCTGPCSVQTVDECLFIVPRENYLGFSSREGWHLYAVEYCLEAGSAGLECKVVPARVWHMSDGKSLDPAYVLQVNEIIREFRDEYDCIATTVKAWKCRGSYLYRKYYYYKQRLKKKL